MIQSGVEDGTFGPCDSWEVANILWTLANALMSKTNLSDADLTDAEGLRAEQLELACGNANTRLPDGLTVKFCE